MHNGPFRNVNGSITATDDEMKIINNGGYVNYNHKPDQMNSQPPMPTNNPTLNTQVEFHRNF